jgi:hypothetical protein
MRANAGTQAIGYDASSIEETPTPADATMGAGGH